MTSGAAVHKTAIVAPNVHLGDGSVVGEYVVLGRAPRGKKEGELELVIGPGAVIRPFTTIYAGTRIGARLQTGQGASIREDNMIGDDVSIGTHASLEFGNRVGSRVRVHTGCFLELTHIEDDVFLGLDAQNRVLILRCADQGNGGSCKSCSQEASSGDLAHRHASVIGKFR